jgi:hypothetical protein
MVTVWNNSPHTLAFCRPTWGYGIYLTVPPYSSTSYSEQDQAFESDLRRELAQYYAGSTEVTWFNACPVVLSVLEPISSRQPRRISLLAGAPEPDEKGGTGA